MNIKELENRCLKPILYSVYGNELCGDTLQDLLSNMVAYINEVIGQTNDNTKLVQGLYDYVRNEGLKQEVINEIRKMVDNGTFEQIINQEIFSDIATDIEGLKNKDVQIEKGIENLKDKVNDNEINIFKNKTKLSDRFVSVKEFGAIGDGVSNDTIPFRNAIDSIKTLGGTIFIPVGKYLIDQIIINNSNITLEGCGENSIILATEEINGPVISTDTGGTGDGNYGRGLVNITIKNLNIVANRKQSKDEFERPTDWSNRIGIYWSGARNNSKVINCRIHGFKIGINSKYNWISYYNHNTFQNCRTGLLLDSECNNISVDNNIFRRCGDVNNLPSAGAMKVIKSYAVNVNNNDCEQTYGFGFVYENCQGINHIGGDIENNDKTVRKIIVKGSDLLEGELKGYSRAINIIGVRFRNCLGIRIENGVVGINVKGCEFSDKSGVLNASNSIQVAGDKIKDVNIDYTNTLFGKSFYESGISVDSLKLSPAPYETIFPSRYFESGFIDISDFKNGVVIGNLEKNFRVTKVELISLKTVSSGSGRINVGIDDNIGDIVAEDIDNTMFNTSTKPYGYKQLNVLKKDNKGFLRCRITTNDIPEGNKFNIRVFYERPY